ncbi:ExeA family protein [Tichowtungia aerotolerans]|uniref:AAA family ATPase n=1 Tax=Tichowtungia aerotolerans TaxID=2697043 RepID=A0A6P1MDT8_9BACT|nr:AAA family ATPase [Tichowtungia aerotolerans]QHI70238.1 AAA family ATPase [Tichowtungia aerotolerans]
MRQPPFESNCDAQFFYESEAHGEALARLLYLVSDRGMGMGAMTGEIGSGKTMVLNVLGSRLRKDLYTTIKLHTAHLPFEHILAEINQQLRGSGDAPGNNDKYYQLKEFEGMLHNKVGAIGKHLILVLDESQFLSKECLDELKCLTNYNQQESLLTIILSGQPELKEKLSSLPQIYQRLGMFCYLKNLRYEEVAPYLQHRLKTAGAEKLDIFEEDSIDPLFSFSGGCPRQINRVCKLAVDRACLMKKDRIDAEMIRMIVRDIEKHFG